MSRFDRVILAAVLGLGLAIGVLSVAAARLGPSVDSVTTASSLDGADVNTLIGVTFTEPMDHRLAERAFHITPQVSGDVSWSGNELYYAPRHPLTYGTSYGIRIDASARGADGKLLSHPYHTIVTTQAEHLLYRGTQGSEKGHLILASIAGARRSVGSDDGQITDFSTSIDGSLVVYVKRGSAGERSDEMWLLSLTDNSSQRLLRRPDWSISEPHFSPDGKSIVFLATNVRLCHQYYGCYRVSTAPVIFLLNLRTLKTHQFASRNDAPLTNFIDFSPAGQIAYTDLGSALTLADLSGNHVVHVPNRGNSLEFHGFDTQGDKAAFVGQTPSSSGGDILVYLGSRYVDVSSGVYDSSTPAFSSSGRQVAFAAYRSELGIEPVYGIDVYSFDTKRRKALTGNRTWSDWGPSWSPDDRYVAFVRSQPQEAMYMGSGEVWVARSDGSGAHPLGGIGENIQWVA